MRNVKKDERRSANDEERIEESKEKMESKGRKKELDSRKVYLTGWDYRCVHHRRDRDQDEVSMALKARPFG